jgi:electron transport complex protein RnfG
MKNILKLGITLAVFAVAACVMLAFVYSGTKSKIAENQENELKAAQKELFPGADSFPEIPENLQSPDRSVTIEKQYEALRGGEPAGVVLQVSRGSFGGPIRILVGVSADNTITGIKILEHSDTPGLGANAASPRYFVDRAAGKTFYGQFTGKSIADPFEVKSDGDVQAITASTVTSMAVTAAVKAAGKCAAAWMAGKEVETDAAPAASGSTWESGGMDASSAALLAEADAAAGAETVSGAAEYFDEIPQEEAE